MTKSAVEQRISRLVGDGKLSGAGALPVSDGFRGAMEEILDNGKATYQEIVKRITDEMHGKERRIIGIWGSWESLADDILDQLTDRKLIRPEHNPDENVTQDRPWKTGMLWLLGEKVETGKSYEAITRAEVRWATGNKEASALRVTLYDAETRFERDRDARALTEVRKLRGMLERLDRVSEQQGKILDNLLASYEGKKEVTDRPPAQHLPDQPETIVYCSFGGEPLVLTSANFDQQLSRGRYHWRHECKNHAPAVKERAAGKRKERVREAVRRYIELEGGEVPSAREIMHRLHLKDDRTLRKDWDALTAAGELPPRNNNN